MKDQASNGRDVERIRALLDAAAPADPGASGRVDAVVRRARQSRTRNGALSAVAVAAVALTVIVGPHLIGGSPVTNSATDPSNGVVAEPSATRPADEPSVSHPDPYRLPCPATPVKVSPSTASIIELQQSDVMVRLCRASGAGAESAWDPPLDALVYDVSGFRAAVAALPPESGPDICPAIRVAPQPFALQITSSAGETQTLSSLMTFCGTVTVNSRRVSTEALLDLFAESLTAQRAVPGFQPPPGGVAPLECRDTAPQVRLGWMSEVTAQTRFIAAITCRPFGDPLNDSQDVKSAPASDAAIDRLNQEWAAHARDLRTHQPIDYDLCSAAAVKSGMTYVTTTWGDVVRMRMVMCGNARIGPFQLVASKALLDALSLPYMSGVHTTVAGD